MKFEIDVHCHWKIKERQDGIWVVVREFENLITTYGINAYAAAPSGTYVAPTNLVLDTAVTTITGGPYSPGATSIQLVADPTIAGDTHLDLSIGTASQETVSFSAKSGSGPYTFTISATVNSHASGDYAARTPTAGDTIASVVSEGQYDPTYFAGLRSPITAYYSPGAGQATMQYFTSGLQLTNMYVSHIGLADAAAIGAGNLHNYATLGFNHNTTNDTEFDVTYTLTGT